MTQHDYNIANSTFTATRSDINNVLAAILSLNAGTSAPSTTVAGMLWYDTTNGIIKQRNAADSAWIHLWAILKQGLIDQNGSTVYAADSVGSDAYAITLTPAITAYAAGQVFRFKAGTANTGAATLAVNGLSAIDIKKNYNSALATGDILANQIVEVAYDALNTTFQLLSPVSSSIAGFPAAYQKTAAPVWASTTTLTVASIREKDSGNTADISKTTSTTVDVSTTGLNGVTLGASNLSGTVSVSSGSASVTFSTSQAGVLQIGDVITTAGGQKRRLSAGSGTSWTAESTFGSTETTVTCKRGGRAPNTHYNLYAISDGSTPGLILSTRNVAGGDTLEDLPSGYTLSRQLRLAVRLDSSSLILPFRTGPGWPDRPLILYRDIDFDPMTSGGVNALNAGTASSFTDVSLASLVPPISQEALLRLVARDNSGSGDDYALFRRKGDSTNGIRIYALQNDHGRIFETHYVGTDSTQTMQYNCGGLAGVAAWINVMGYVVTEV